MKNGEKLEIPSECAVKVFKTSLNEFKTRDKCIKDDYRFKERFSKQAIPFKIRVFLVLIKISVLESKKSDSFMGRKRVAQFISYFQSWDSLSIGCTPQKAHFGHVLYRDRHEAGPKVEGSHIFIGRRVRVSV